MKKAIVALTVLACFASSALAAPRHFLAVSPHAVRPGEAVRVHGSVAGGCVRGDRVTLYSPAFKGSTRHRFAGVPAVFAKVRRRHGFSIRVRLSDSIAPRRYRVGGRCGGGNFGSARLIVRKAARPQRR